MTRVFPYVIAVLSVVVALAVRLGLEPILGPTFPLMAFVLAVVAATHFGGRGPGLAATALSVPLACFFFIEPRYSFAIADPRDLGSLLLLAAAGAGISLLAGSRHIAVQANVEGETNVEGERGRFNAPFLRRALLLGGAFVLLAVLTRLLYSDFEREKDRHYWVTHTYEVLNQVHLLTSRLERAETAQRGYLLTGDVRYLKTFQSALRDEQSARLSLSRLTADNPSQQVRLDALDRLVEATFSALRRAIALRDTKGHEAALALVRTGESQRIMDQCRAALDAMEGAEHDLLTKRSEAADAQVLRTRWVLGLGSGSLLILLVIAGAVIERDIQHREMIRQAVRRGEERLRLALDAANAGTWEWDLRTNENVWSDEIWKLYGLEPNRCEPSYEVWRQAIHPDDRAEVERVVGEAARSGDELNVEYRVCGGERWLLARGQPLRDAKGQAESYLGIVLDITHRKQAEEALREREENLRRFTDAAPVAIAMFDREMRYLAASRRFRDDYHLGPQEVIGHSHYEIFPEVPEPWREIHRRCLAGAVERHEGERFLRADGSEQWIRWEIQPWRRADGEIGGIVLFSEDTTRQRSAEQAREESEARLRLAQQVARVGTFERNIQTGVSAWSPGMEAIYGLPPGGFPKTPHAWESLVHPEDRPGAARQLEQAIETGKYEAEFRVVWPDGSLRWLAARGSLFRDEAGKPLRVVGVNIDITGARQAGEALRRTHADLIEAQRVAHVGSWHWDRKTDAVTCSEELYDLFGLDPKLPFPDFKDQERMYTPESWRRLNSAVETAAQTGTIYEMDLEVVRPDGERRWVASRGEAVRDEDGKIVALHRTLQDVTRRKLAESETLARSAVLLAISRVFSESLICETEQALGEACLSIAEELTGSKFGFMGDGTGGRAIIEGKGFYTNDPQSHPGTIGLPPKHPPLTALLGVPLVHSGTTIGMIAVANREGGYGPRELAALEGLAPAMVQAFMRKRAEEAQRASEAQFRTLANAIPQLCWMANADGWVYWYNQRWYEYTGTTPEQMEGWGWRSVHDPEALPKVLERWKASIASGELFDMVFPLRGADGTFHPFLTRVMPVRDREGKVVQWFGTNTDITEQVTMVAALRQASEQRRLAMEAADLGSWDYRFQTGDVCWDDRCRRMFGANSERIPYVEAIAQIHPEDRVATEEGVKQAIANGGGYTQEFRVVWPDGSVHWIASHGRGYSEGENGHYRVTRFTGVNMEITGRKQAELEIRLLNSQLEQRVRQRTAELETANKELEAFSYSVSHDLRAPLRGIDGWSLALAEDYADQLDERAQQYLHRVRTETQRMGLLIDDMLQLSRIASSEMRQAPVDLTAIGHRVAAGLKEANAGRRVEFVIEPGLNTSGDARLLEIALTNLLANAVKFTGRRQLARVEFSSILRGGETVFYVRDNGVGFDMAYAGALFGAFQRLHKASEFPGTGIGLAIVQRVIHRHRGRVWAEAQRDHGATFYFTIGATA